MGGAKEKKSKQATTAFKRMATDMANLEIPSSVVLNSNDMKENKLVNFRLVITPHDGYWKGHPFRFRYQVPDEYPYMAPKITCMDKVYHPNINLEGNVCLNILR